MLQNYCFIQYIAVNKLPYAAELWHNTAVNVSTQSDRESHFSYQSNRRFSKMNDVEDFLLERNLRPHNRNSKLDAFKKGWCPEKCAVKLNNAKVNIKES